MIVEISLSDIPKKSVCIARNVGAMRGRGRIQKEITQFLSGGKEAAEIMVPHGSKARNVADSYACTIKRSNFPARIMQRGDRVFLVRGDIDA